MLTIRNHRTPLAKLGRFVRRAPLYGLALLVAVSTPFAAVYADDPAPQPTATVAPAAETTAQAATTSSTTPSESTPPAPEPQKTYTYDSETQRWNSDEWQYDKTTDTYVPTPQPTTQSTTPPPATDAPQTTSTSTGTSSTTTTTAVTNVLDSLAQSGNADVLRNTAAGDATTGGALATATVINNVNSIVTNTNNQEVATFVSDVMGDTNGDIILQPMLLKAMLEAGSAQTTQATVANDTSLQNDLQLTATSGNATVAQNTSAGNATTGSAHTVADVVNIVNSMVSANQSFIGTINIYGNLNGDILIAPDFIPQLIANNQEIQASTVGANTSVESRDTQEIINNVALAAESGQAIVDRNTAAGNATTGDASTNLVIFNLSGHEIVAENSLLVFVNVLGSWVGVIVDAPTGATAGVIGNNVSQSEVTQPDLILSVDNSTRIVNNLDLASRSGDALVTANTSAGNATTGNATASANILNMSSSQLHLAGWFGILFINVFGTWNGSFGIDTAAGTKAIVPSPAGSSKPPKVIQFVPRQQAVVVPVKTTFVTPEGLAEVPSSQVSEALAADPAKVSLARASAPTVLGQDTTKNRPLDIVALIGSFVLIVVSAYGLRRFLF